MNDALKKQICQNVNALIAFGENFEDTLAGMIERNLNHLAKKRRQSADIRPLKTKLEVLSLIRKEVDHWGDVRRNFFELSDFYKANF